MWAHHRPGRFTVQMSVITSYSIHYTKLYDLAYQNEHPKLIRVAERFIERFGGDDEVFFLLGVSLYKLGLFDGAIVKLEESISREKSNIV